MNEQFILKSLQRKLDIISNSVMSEEEIQKAFTTDELNLIEKAKYIRREGTKGNYKYIYEEPKEGGGKKEDLDFMIHENSKEISSSAGMSESEFKGLHPDTKKELAKNYIKSKQPEKKEESSKFKQIKGDEVFGEKWRKKSKEEIQKEIDYINKELKDNPNNIGKTNENFKRKLDYLNELIKQQSQKKEEPKVEKIGSKLSVSDKIYSWGRLITVSKGNSWTAVLHPEQQEQISKLGVGESTSIKDEQGHQWEVINNGDGFNLQGKGETSSNYKGHFQIPVKKSENSDVEKAETGEKKVAKVMREFKEGKLKSSSGEVVTDRDQAIAIAMSEAGLSKD